MAHQGPDRDVGDAGRAREPLAVPAPQAAAAAGAHAAVGRDAHDVDPGRRQALVDREMGEVDPVEAVHAVLGGEPQKPVAVLGDAEHDQVLQPVLPTEHEERKVALRLVFGRSRTHRGRREPQPDHAREPP
jgi:hypothetical protein